ncbi:MAG: ABC transporter substrate-binding protein [Roseibium sp.]|uniref:ABC transporter substrate-binding protein n=1 Tax=Roseibium sp. TaxID=1936156 RepID=UPI003D9C43BA
MRKLLLSTAMLALVMSANAGAQELRVGLSTHITNMDPQDQTGNNGAPMLYQIYDTLIERDSFSNPLTFKPGLATEWKLVEPTVWELKLRENVKMHDGTTMDADDVAFSLNRMILEKDPEFAAAWGRWFYNFEKVEVVDPLTVRIHTLRAEPNFETLISARSAGITSKEHYEKLGFEDAALSPVGTGPYKVTEFVPRDLAVMERYDDYWGEKAPFEKIEFKHVEEVASRVTGLVNGEFDLVTNIPPDQESAVQADGINTMGVTWPMFHVWIIAQNTPPTDNPLVRKALRLCTDRQAMVDGLWGGKAHVPLAHQFEEYGAPYFIEGLELIKFDPEEGKRLLAEAGYNGEPVLAQFPRSYYLYGDLAAQVIQQQWAECGVKLELQEVDEIDYERMNVRAWSNPMYYPDPMGAMDTHWSDKSWVSSRGPLWSPSHPEWKTTYEEARYSTDPEVRKDAYRKLLDLAEIESGWILLYEPHELYGMRDGLSFEIPVAQRPYVLPLRAGEVTIGENY